MYMQKKQKTLNNAKKYHEVNSLTSTYEITLNALLSRWNVSTIIIKTV